MSWVGRAARRVAASPVAAVVVLVAATALAGGDTRVVGRQADGSVLTPTRQLLTPAGRQLEFPGRPTAVALNPRGRTATVLSNAAQPLAVVDLTTNQVLQRPGSTFGPAAATGLAYAPDGSRLYASFARGFVVRFDVDPDGTLQRPARLALPRLSAARADVPAGIAVARDGRRLFVALNLSNRLAVLDSGTGAVVETYPVGVAPHDVVRSGNTVIVGNRGGRRARAGDLTNDSAGTKVVATKTSGSAATGTVTVVDRTAGTVTNVRVGLHPSGISVRGRHAFVANANSDSVSVVDVPARRVVATIPVRPFPGAPYGSSPNAVAPFGDDRLAVTLGRNNAVAVYRWSAPDEPAAVEGLLPVGWYPGDVAVRATGELVVANLLGVGAVPPDGGAADPARPPRTLGSLSAVPFPTAAALDTGTAAVFANNGWSAAPPLPPRAHVPPVAIPERIGEPSLIKHVFYVIKENRTYDQILGDDPRGNGDPRYVQFGADVTPNHHALARRFPLLDNFYVSGSTSIDAHQWVTQAYVTDYVERSFSGWPRGYPFDGGDALAYAPSGFLWENAERHGKSVRVYGEFANHTDGTGTRSDVPSLDRILARHYPRFDLDVLDTTRAAIFVDDLREQVATGTVPNLTIIQLPLNHTHGLAPGAPTPEFDVADNDAALGRIVAAISGSEIWDESAIFVVEDDAQAGLDHVDRHRTTAFAVSPYAVNGSVDSTYYTQIDMIRTIEHILGLPPMNQMDHAAKPMTTVFGNRADLRPFTAFERAVAYQTNPSLSQLRGTARLWAEASGAMDFSNPDRPHEQVLNRAIWYAVRGYVPYPGDGRVMTPAEIAKRYQHYGGELADD